MTCSKIALHHVGGRWGNHPFPIPSRFAKDFAVTLYEADADAIEGIREATKNEASDIAVIQACLAETDCDKTLRLTLNPGATSLLECGTAIDGYYEFHRGVDFEYPEAVGLIGERTLPARSLDSLVSSGMSPPDFLTLDVQAYEYQVLQGASETLERHVCGLIVEVEFVHLYKGQRRFQDICDLLNAAGFVFVRFLNSGEVKGPRAPLGYRGRGYQIFADALFLRRPRADRLDDIAIAVHEKLCFCAVVFNMTELAVECFEVLRGAGKPFAGGSGWRAFLAELFEAYDRGVKFMPPLFNDILPPEHVLDFSSAGDPDQWPAIFRIGTYSDDYLRHLTAMQRGHDTDFEAVLRRYGFNDCADCVRDIRQDQATKILSLIESSRR